MTPTDEVLHDALRRGDVRRAAELLDPTDCEPDVIERLLRHEDARVRSLGLTLLGERVEHDEPAVLAVLLPTALSAAGDGAVGEDALALAELYARLGPHLPKPYAVVATRRPGVRPRSPYAYRSPGCAPRSPTTRRPSAASPAGELLHQAVRETGIAHTARPHQLIAELADSGDQVLVDKSFRLAREGLHAGVLTAGLVRAHLSRLLDLDADGEAAAGTVVAALAELAEPWATLEPCSTDRPSSHLSAAAVAVRPEVADAALGTLARHGHGGVLRQAVDDPDLPPRLRRRALELLGSLATRHDIGELITAAARDPLLFGEAGRGLPARPPPARTLRDRRRCPGRPRTRAGRPRHRAARRRDRPVHLPSGHAQAADRRPRRRSELAAQARPPGRAGRAGHG